MEKIKKIKKEERCVTQPFVLAGVVLEEDGEFLLVQEENKWNLPMGWVELGEDLVSAAEREAQEETGWKVKAKDFLGVYTVVKRKPKVLHMVKFVFVAEKEGKSEEENEDLKKKKFTFEEVKNLKNKGLLWHPEVVDQLQDYKEGKRYPLEAVSYFSEI